ncbi:MAG TPA: hypothetical protein VFZ18_05020, partial [Longimicrobiaceae bacterium]
TFDTAATALRLLGVDLPAAHAGRPVFAAFDGMTDAPSFADAAAAVGNAVGSLGSAIGSALEEAEAAPE